MSEKSNIEEVLKEIPSLSDDELDKAGQQYHIVHAMSKAIKGDDDQATKEALTVLTALKKEWHKRHDGAVPPQEKTEAVVPNSYNELMAQILSGDVIEEPSKDELNV